MVIISGATGFVGRYLVDHLVRNGEEVVACGRTRKYEAFFAELGVPFVYLDVTEADSFANLPTGPADAFVHLAGVIPATVEDPHSDIFLQVNTLGTFRALEYCRKQGTTRFVFSTTLYEGLEHSTLPISEDMGYAYAMTGDHAVYVISKIAASQLVEHYRQEYGFQGIMLRFTGLLGYGRQEGYYQDGVLHPSAFEVFYQRAKAGEPLEIWGAHSARRDSLYVKDAVRAIDAALHSPDAGGLYLIGSGQGRTVEEEARVFAEVFGTPDCPIPIVYRPELEDKQKSYYFDISKATRELGWEPAYSYSDILIDYDREVALGRFKQ